LKIKLLENNIINKMLDTYWVWLYWARNWEFTCMDCSL
jgi:hypothetical protein